MLKQIVSGGQTGVDRAALDAALQLNIPCGGWCPKGRRAEDGPIAPSYPLRETPSDDYAQRTEWNVRDSDGTLILAWGEPTGGTGFTLQVARRLNKPCFVIDMNTFPNRAAAETTACVEWAHRHSIAMLNVAGPRQDPDATVYAAARAVLTKLYAKL